MVENVLVRDCSTGFSEDVASYWDQRRAQIERLLKRFSENQRRVRLSVGCRDLGYTARAVATLPTGTLVARTTSRLPDHRAAIDDVVNKLVAEIRRHDAQLHDDQVQGRRRRRERDFAAAESHLSALHDEKDSEAFFEVLRPLLRHVRSHARRELRMAEIEGALLRNELTADDLLDEVITRAWDRWDRRPRNQPLERWLVELLHEILDERGFKPPDDRNKSQAPADRQTEPASIWERVREDEPRFEAEDNAAIEENPDWPYAGENEWITNNDPYWPFLDPLLQEAQLPAEGSVDPWQELAADEEWRMILDEFSKFPKDQRRAFTLHAFEGWPINDIAAMQSRPAEQVRADIDAVRNALRERLKEVMS